MDFDASPRLEGGHRSARIQHRGDDTVGAGLARVLRGAVDRSPAIRWIDARASDLTTAPSGRVTGVVTASGETIDAGRVVLATGGAAAIYSRHTGPPGLLGDGMAIAFRAGAFLADLEFTQFHPTALAVPDRPATLLTEALRGAGARLLDRSGRPFMTRWHPLGDLAPRDIVSLASWTVGVATLDATGVEGVRLRFPGAAAVCAEAGFDLGSEPIPVAPAAHYTMGGVLTDTWGRTTVPGLLACGEVACTGLHGANRLASNSLTEAIVLGRRTAHADAARISPPRIREPLHLRRSEAPLSLREVRGLFDRSLGVVREGSGLSEAVARLAISLAARAPLLVGALASRAALMREESRGSHFRLDFPFGRLRHSRTAVSRDGWATLDPRR